MRVPVVKIVRVKRKNIISYQLDYSLNRKRVREIVAHNKRDAELIRAQRQQDLTLGTRASIPLNLKSYH